jgi:hypothetical protein
VLWVSYVGGNIRDWTLWTSVPGTSSPKQIRTISRDVDLPGPFAIGPGDQDVLPYGQDAQVIALHADGSRRFAWNAPARVIAVAAGSGRWRCCSPPAASSCSRAPAPSSSSTRTRRAS